MKVHSTFYKKQIRGMLNSFGTKLCRNSFRHGKFILQEFTLGVSVILPNPIVNIEIYYDS